MNVYVATWFDKENPVTKDSVKEFLNSCKEFNDRELKEDGKPYLIEDNKIFCHKQGLWGKILKEDNQDFIRWFRFSNDKSISVFDTAFSENTEVKEIVDIISTISYGFDSGHPIIEESLTATNKKMFGITKNPISCIRNLVPCLIVACLQNVFLKDQPTKTLDIGSTPQKYAILYKIFADIIKAPIKDNVITYLVKYQPAFDILHGFTERVKTFSEKTAEHGGLKPEMAEVIENSIICQCIVEFIEELAHSVQKNSLIQLALEFPDSDDIISQLEPITETGLVGQVVPESVDPASEYAEVVAPSTFKKDMKVS